MISDIPYTERKCNTLIQSKVIFSTAVETPINKGWRGQSGPRVPIELGGLILLEPDVSFFISVRVLFVGRRSLLLRQL